MIDASPIHASLLATALAAFAVGLPVRATAAPSTEGPRRCEAEGAIVVHADDAPEARARAHAIGFELEQAGYVVAPTPGCEQGTLTLERVEDRWHLHYAEVSGDVAVEATAGQDDPPQVLGLHAVELIHAAELLRAAAAYGPSPARAEPAPSRVPQPPASGPPEPTVPTVPTEPTEPTEPTPKDTRWMVELGVASSTMGLVGPRIGVAHHTRSFELGIAAEAGFGGDRAFGSPRTTEPGAVLVDDRAATRVNNRAVVELGYVFRPARRLRPSLGVANAVLLPIVGTRYDHPGIGLTLTHVGIGVLWVPAPELGLRLDVRPGLAVRASLRAGPVVAVKPVAVAGEGRFAVPRWTGTATLGVLFGRR